MPGKTAVKPAPNLLDLIPKTLVDWTVDEQQRVLLKVPKISPGSFWARLFPSFSQSYFKVHLDDRGSFIWQQCDGETPVSEIAARLARHCNEEEQSLYERIALFLRRMEREGLIRLAGGTPPR